MSELTLVILAAGMGSRYGGLKQLDGVGPHGEVLMEYSLYDAHQAGVTRFVFVIRESFEQAFQESILARIPKNFDIQLCFQNTQDLPIPTSSTLIQRTKPWGTGQAVWSARSEVKGPFFVINADDYYGPQAFKLLSSALIGQEDPDPVMVGFHLAQTLSVSGTVSRGICEVENGKLLGITERTKLYTKKDGLILDDESQLSFLPETLVSMNCWGFSPKFFSFLGNDFAQFLQELTPQDAPTKEFYLPAAVDRYRANAHRPVKVLASDESWLGVTYPSDKDAVVRGVRHRIAQGFYPERLWS